MVQFGVHRLEVEAMLADFSKRETGAGLVAYHGVSGGRSLLVIIADESDPPLVIAVVEEG